MNCGDVFLHLDRMVEAGQLIAAFIAGLDLEKFAEDDLVRSAVAMQSLTIGEAAGRLGRDHPELIAQYSSAPWRGMVGMRNRIAHVYYDLHFPTVWRVASVDVPELLKNLEPIYEAAGETFGADGQNRTKSD